MTELISRVEAARLLELSVEQFDKLARPNLTPVRHRGQVCFHRDEVDNWDALTDRSVWKKDTEQETDVGQCASSRPSDWDPIECEAGFPGTQLVYFLEAIGTGLVKIGKTDQFDARVRTLQLISPVPLRLLKVIEGYTDQEKFFHSLWAEHRSHGEWFRLAPIAQAIGLLQPANAAAIQSRHNERIREFLERKGRRGQSS